MVGPLQFRVNYRHISGRAGPQRAAAGKLEYLGRVCRAHLDEANKIDHAFIDELTKGKADRRFQAGDAEWRPVVFERFFVRVMRRVIGCYGINSAVRNTFDDGLEMFGRSQWWRHLGIRVVAFDSLVRQCKMMRRDLTRDIQAVTLCAANG